MLRTALLVIGGVLAGCAATAVESRMDRLEERLATLEAGLEAAQPAPPAIVPTARTESGDLHLAERFILRSAGTTSVIWRVSPQDRAELIAEIDRLLADRARFTGTPAPELHVASVDHDQLLVVTGPDHVMDWLRQILDAG